MSMQEMRKKIDEVDDKIVRLIAERIRQSQSIGHEKQKSSKPVEDATREKKVLAHIAAVARAESTLLFRLGVMDAKSVASIGYRGFRRGKVLVIPGFKNKFGAFAVRLGPRLVVRKTVKWLQS